MCGSIINDIFIFWRTAREDTRLNIYCTEFGDLTNLKAFETSLRFFCEQGFVRRIVDDFRCARDSILTKIDVCHFTFNLFHKMY